MKCIRLQKHAGIREIVKSPSVKKRSYKRMVALDVVRPKSSDLIDLMEGMRFIESEGRSPAFVHLAHATTKTLNSHQGLFRRETGQTQKGFEL